MAFLIRRNKRATAGWADNFNRPNQNPIGYPWAFWGTAAAFSLFNNQLKLAADGAPARGGNYDGGVAYEQQPLTPNWVIEFTRAPIGNTSTSNSNETRQQVFLDKNWTEGGNASSTLFQVGLELQSVYTEEKKNSDGEVTTQESQTRSVRFFTRDKTDTSGSFWIFTVYGSIGSDSTTVGATAWATSLKIKIMVLQDRYLIGWVNPGVGTVRPPELLVDLFDTRFRFGDRKRAANFAQVSGLIASIDDFKTYDIDPILRPAASWTATFEDTFNRTNNTSVLNGWTQTAGNNFGIYQSALSMNSPTSGTDGFRQVRRNSNARDVRIEFVLGGGTGDPALQIRSAILARMNSAGTKGLAMIISPRSVTIHGFTWTGALGTPPVYTGDTQPILAFGTDYINQTDTYSLNISGDYAWVINETTDRMFYFRDGVNALGGVDPADTWVGAFVARNAFVNSAAINNYKILV